MARAGLLDRAGWPASYPAARLAAQPASQLRAGWWLWARCWLPDPRKRVNVWTAQDRRQDAPRTDLLSRIINMTQTCLPTWNQNEEKNSSGNSSSIISFQITIDKILLNYYYRNGTNSTPQSNHKLIWKRG